MFPAAPELRVWAVTVVSANCGGLAAGTVKDSSVATFTPSFPVNTVPIEIVCCVNRPLYNVKLPTAVLASWWPCPVVGAVNDFDKLTGAKVLVEMESCVVKTAGFERGTSSIVTVGYLRMAMTLLARSDKTNRNTRMIKCRSARSCSLDVYLGRGCVGISETA